MDNNYIGIIPMEIDNSFSLVENLAADAVKNQHLRELVQNGIEAGATAIQILSDPFAPKGVKRLMYMDNGKGMDCDELCAYFNHLACMSQKEMTMQGNKGIGAKITTLPWNHAGVIVMSWQEGGEYGCQITMKKDGNKYGLQQHIVTDQFGYDELSATIEPDPRYCPEWVTNPEHKKYTGSGTVVILLGNTETEDTLLGEDGISSQYGNQRILSKRYFTVPQGVEISCESNRADKPTIRVVTTKDRLDNYCSASGVVEVPKAKAYWWLIDTKRDWDHGVWYAKGFLGTIYGDDYSGAKEVYDTVTDGRDLRWKMTAFGITEPSVRDQVVILVEPDKATSKNSIGVWPNGARSKLLFPSEDKSLPWADWGDAFRANLPPEIQAALDIAQEKDTATKYKLDDLLKHVADRLKGMRFTRTNKSNALLNSIDLPGTENGIETEIPAAPEPKLKPEPNPDPEPKPEPDPDDPPKPRKPRGIKPKRKVQKLIHASGEQADDSENTTPFNPTINPPEPKWVNPADGYEDLKLAADYNPDNPGTVLMNETYPLFQQEYTFWKNEYPHAAPSEVQSVVRHVYSTALASRIMHHWSLKGNFMGDWNDGLSQESLTFSLLGLHQASKEIAKSLSSRHGKA